MTEVFGHPHGLPPGEPLIFISLSSSKEVVIRYAPQGPSHGLEQRVDAGEGLALQRVEVGLVEYALRLVRNELTREPIFLGLIRPPVSIDHFWFLIDGLR